MKTIEQAKEILRNSLYNDEFIDFILETFDDKTWLELIRGTEINTNNFYRWLNQVPQLKIYMDPKNTYEYSHEEWNPALIFINMLFEEHERRMGIAGKNVMKVAVLLFPEEILEPYIVSTMLKKVKIITL